jgi:hypothetical protein
VLATAVALLRSERSCFVEIREDSPMANFNCFKQRLGAIAMEDAEQVLEDVIRIIPVV